MIRQEKASAFSSVGSSAKNGAGGASALNAAVFRRFNGSSPPAARAECSAEARADADDDDGASGSGVRLDVEDIAAGSHGRESRKRKSPLGACASSPSSSLTHHASTSPRVLIPSL